jgi:stage II sporulation protein D
VYKGMTGVNENVRAAVRQTRGEVLGWKGKLLRVYYHACCGGATTDVGAAWGGEGEIPRPLRGVRDPWCAKSPHMKWIVYFAWADLTAAISERRMLRGPLKSLRIGARDAAGYVRTFLIRSGGENVEVRASELRGSLGAGEMKSVRIQSVSLLKKGVEFVGGGSGHGVGLCQWGARLQAEKGRGYGQILSFYFPGSELSEVDVCACPWATSTSSTPNPRSPRPRPSRGIRRGSWSSTGAAGRSNTRSSATCRAS